jgi:hypothetical protein
MSATIIYFILGLLAFLVGFGFFIAFAGARLSGRISAQTFGLIEKIIIAGVLLGMVGMFQPWSIAGYHYGFLLLLLSTLGYIVWSHVTPASEQI